MKKKLHTPEGVRDIYNVECGKKLALESRLKKVFHLYGYHYIQTPTIEYFDVCREEIGTTPANDLYKFFDKDGNKLTDYINATWKKGTNYCRVPVKDSEKYSGYKIMIPHDFTLDSINFSSKEGGDLKSPN